MVRFIFFLFFFYIFFFQAEDGIRDRDVTGVQTCALPTRYFVVSAPGLELVCKCFFATFFCFSLVYGLHEDSLILKYIPLTFKIHGMVHMLINFLGISIFLQ